LRLIDFKEEKDTLFRAFSYGRLSGSGDERVPSDATLEDGGTGRHGEQAR
jgi:hypothetical protein